MRGEWIEIVICQEMGREPVSPLMRGEWIEMTIGSNGSIAGLVSPHARGVD